MNRPIVADTSAIVAIALGEPEREIFLDRILSAEKGVDQHSECAGD